MDDRVIPSTREIELRISGAGPSSESGKDFRWSPGAPDPAGATLASQACSCLHRVETCRCGLSLLQAAAKRILLAGQRRLLDDLALQLFRLAAHYRRGGCVNADRRPPCGDSPCEVGPGRAADELRTIVTECLSLLDHGAPIDGVLARIPVLAKRLESLPGAGPGDVARFALPRRTSI